MSSDTGVFTPEVNEAGDRPGKKKSMKSFVKEFIWEAYQKCRNNPALKQAGNRILTSDVFYNLRDAMQKEGWGEKGWNHPTMKRREKIQVQYVNEVCAELGIKRSDAGIMAGEMAHMYFRGQRYSVGLDNIRSLSHNGTDILLIEKEGIAEQFRDLAGPYGIAIIHGRGFMTEYASELSDLCRENGANIFILTDFDISGRLIALKIQDAKHIGIDFDTLEDLGIPDSREKLQELYNPEYGHVKHIEDNYHDIKDLDYMRGEKTVRIRNGKNGKMIETVTYTANRIEIHAVKNEVGKERFWKWIVKKIEESAPTRDYNRAIEMPDAFIYDPVELDEVTNIIRSAIHEVLDPLIEDKKEQLRNYEGLIENVMSEESDIEEEFREEINGQVQLNGLKGDLRDTIEKWRNGGYVS
jgi:5S rRNA maturation endonuclease (ribonuclease M5)